jgi:hypothetical protein
MKHKVVLICTLVCMGVAAAVLTWRERDLNDKSEQVEGEFAANRRAAVAIGETRRHASKEVSPAVPPAAVRPRPSSFEIGRRVEDRLVHSPEYAALRRRQFRRTAMEQYAEWFAQLRLPPERLAFVKNAIVDKLMLSQDALEAGLAAGYRMGTREFEGMVMKYVREADAQLAQVLSADELASFKEYEKVKWFVTGNLPEIREAFVDQNAPALSTEQVAALSSAWKAKNAWRPAGANKVGTVYRAQNEKLLELTAPSLQPAQNAALAEYVRYMNTKSRRLGELANPDDPDRTLISISKGRY